MSFEAAWASGVDRFDFARTGSIDSNKGGNNILDKATQLASGNYAGLMTYAGDADCYQLNTVYADELNVTVSGAGLIVKEFDAAGNELQNIFAENGQYILIVQNGNYLYVEGYADINSNAVNSYTLQVSDLESTYQAPEDGKLVAEPVVAVSTNSVFWTENLCVTATTSENALIYYSVDLQTWNVFDETFAVTSAGIYFFKAVDIETGLESDYKSLIITAINSAELQGGAERLMWKATLGNNGYIVEYSTDNFASSVSLYVTTEELAVLALPKGNYSWRVRTLECPEWVIGNNIISDNDCSAKVLVSTSDGNTDVFFANASGEWTAGYAAQHTGILNGWAGTNEQVNLAGKSKLADIFEGSTDANILLMTDNTNGDALFVDDIYTALPGTIDEQQARIAQIDEIRAGLGDDIVDMTSQRFAYVGDGVKIYGGLGNDTIWANNGSNTLFGDAGNDRIVGGANNDVIVGGIGNDSMHGGSGSDIFYFGGDWGTDTVEQLANGSVTLWFEEGSESNWDADTLTYTDGANSVTVSGVTNITLRFGADTSLPAGCFADAASEKIFEDKNKGLLA